jgi:aspartyl-tRNA(Asn)/glutamyl-tRNA(Gln) amidotransferase subunit A
MSAWHVHSAAQLRHMLDEGQVSATTLAEHFLARIQASSINAFLDVQASLTLAQAAQADARLKAGEKGGLLGLPIAHKDIFCTQGWRTTAGSKMLGQYVSPFDATVVAQVQSAGAVCLGKLNCDEFAMGSSNENSAFGPVQNPWNLNAIPGGSSGGSAAAVAAGLALLTTGTDTGGSVRQPAAMCGITGIKPTYGLASRYGMIAYASSLDQAGAMGRSAQDCAYLLNALVGFDPKDSTSVDAPVPNYVGDLAVASPEQSLKGLRIGIPKEFFGDGLDSHVQAHIEQALEVMRLAGAQLVPVDLPNAQLAIPAYYVIAPAEASSNLSRFDGVRYGHRASNPKDLRDLYERSRTEGFGAEVQRRILVGAYVLSQGYYDAYYLQAQRLRRLIAQDFEQAFTKVDVIAGPVSPTVAWAIGSHQDDPVADYLADIFTLPASLAGLPGLSMPVGRHASLGLPVGLQLIGPAFTESRLLAVAHGFQQLTAWHLERAELAC